MSAKEDLQKKVQSLQDQLATAIASLNQILIAEYPYEPGMVVMYRGKQYRISTVRMKGRSPRAWGKKTLKNGEFGNQEFELYGKIESVE